MSEYAVAHIDEIDEITDGRCPWRPVRHHFGITAFGVNAFTANDAGDRLINEHDESDEHDLQEERFRPLAAEDSDFDPIRDEPAFKELVSGRASELAKG